MFNETAPDGADFNDPIGPGETPEEFEEETI